MLDILRAKASGDWVGLNEASLGRVYQHIQRSGETSFAILTSWRAGETVSDNKANLKRLEGQIRGRGLGFFKLLGHWKECQLKDTPYAKCPQDQLKDIAEPALFVPGLSFEAAKRFRAEYDQDAVIYSGPEFKGRVALITKGGYSDLGEFSPNKVAQNYSRLRGRPFAFEYVAQSWSECLVEQQFDPQLGRLINELRVELTIA